MREVVIIGYHDSELVEISGVSSCLDVANRIGVTPQYRVRLATPGGNDIACQSGLVLRGEHSLERLTGPLDTLIVSGGFGSRAAADNARVTSHVRRLAAESRRVASVCTGAEILAAAGLLDGKRITTHWLFADRIAAQYPNVTMDAGPIYIREHNVTTAAGVTSAFDLALAFIEDDHGAAVAREVARAQVTYLHRPGNQAQMSMFVAAPPADHDLVRRAVGYINSHLDEDLSAKRVAGEIGVSERHLTRLFVAELGQAPGRFVRRSRTEAAAQLLAGTRLPVAGIATRCGFGSAETLRQAFTDRYGTSPSRFRAAYADSDTAADQDSAGTGTSV
ncbi:GlxA family transcriptional regulator [Nocardia altamirensis]|uniref:GlxA family transcriptional regulator n=1 Tax=Nocardia altamirensis TaxID=472158 RepID=UPI0008406D24|nr:DJ-1/PfpI family protein [Nocardia altamirensis]